MSFDAVAFAMGKAGASRDLVSALMGGSGGGGGSGTLEESGYVYSKSGNCTVSGNTVYLPKGSTSTALRLRPPTSIFRGTLELAITVTEVKEQINVEPSPTNGTFASKTGLFTIRSGTMSYATSTGSDVITLTFSDTASYVEIKPKRYGNTSGSDVFATIDITGMRYNGETIFGKV